jgi:predicted metal-dependent hydrolase
MPLLTIQDQQISYKIVQGKSLRYVYLKFRPDLTLEVRIPQGKAVTPDVDDILRQKKTWILRKYGDLTKSKRLSDNGRLMFDGRYLNVIIEQQKDRRVKPPEVRPGEVVLYTRRETGIKNLVRQWFARETLNYLEKTLPDMASRLSVKYQKMDVRELKKWGYCSRNGRLSFSWQLIALPKRLRDYILLHELTHLSEFNHSNTFHRRLASVCPDYKEREKELKQIIPL